MTQGSSTEINLEDWHSALADTSEHLASLLDDDSTGFGAEFRELARQRRFVRRNAPGSTSPAPALPEPASGAPEPAPAAAPAVSVATPAAPTPTGSSEARAVGISSRDAAAMFTEVSRSIAQLGAAREELATQRARADQAETQLASVNQRLLAARVLVHDAQRATHMSAERCAWLEGRNEALSEALDRAVNASMLTRWRWRRQLVRERLGAAEAG